MNHVGNITTRAGLIILVLNLVRFPCPAEEQGKSVIALQEFAPIEVPGIHPFDEEDAGPENIPLAAPPIVSEGATVFTLEPEVAGPPVEVPDGSSVRTTPGALESPLGIRVSELRLPRKLSNHYLLYREDNTGTEILPKGQSGMGLTTLAFSGSVLTEADGNAFWIDPRFEWTFVNGPVQVDLPPQLFELTLACNAIARTDLLDLHFFFAPMLASDFDNMSADAWRFQGGAMGVVELSPQWSVIGGALYLDRPDLPVMPHAGVLWRPGDNVELDLVIPSPRLAVCFDSEGDDDLWMYCGVNVGGGSWAYERIDSTYDQLGYFDMRVVLGFEHRNADMSLGQWEVGYVFNRRVELDRTGRQLDLPDSFVIRWAGSF